MKKSFLRFMPITFITVLIAVFAGLLISGYDPKKLSSPLVGKPVPTFSLPHLFEPEKRLTNKNTQSANIVLINFFASWCVTCRAEQKIFAALQDEYNLAIYGIAYKDKAEDTKEFLAQHGNPFKVVAFDSTGQTAINFGVYGVPETFVINTDGTILYRHAGTLTPKDVQKIILPYLNKGGP